MSDESIQDTPDVSTPYCPGCEPDRDPLAEILRERWCDEHNPKRDGDMDDEAQKLGLGTDFLPSTGMAEGSVSNTRACDIIHRDSPQRENDRSGE